MAAEVFAIHGVAASETGTALADALIALCDDAMPGDQRSWLVFSDPIDAAAAAHLDRIISTSPAAVGEVEAASVIAAPLDGPALALFEPLPEAPTRTLASVLIESKDDEAWVRLVVERLLGKYTLTVASRVRDDLAGLFRTEGVWSLVAPRRRDWIDLVSRHDLVITSDPYTAALANGVLKPVLLVEGYAVLDLPVCLAAELDGIEDQLSRLDMVSIGADLLNGKRRAREEAVRRIGDALGDGGT